MTLKALYNAFPAAMLVSTALFRVRWLEMRINIGWIFFALWGIFAFTLTFILIGDLTLVREKSFPAKLPDMKGTTANLLICGLGVFFLLGKARVFFIPAAIVREGLGFPRLPFLWINLTIASFLLSGWLFLFFTSRKRGWGT